MWSAGCRQRDSDSTRSGLLKPQRPAPEVYLQKDHTHSNKATPPNPTQTVPLMGTKHSDTGAYENAPPHPPNDHSGLLRNTNVLEACFLDFLYRLLKVGHCLLYMSPCLLQPPAWGHFPVAYPVLSILSLSVLIVRPQLW